jgi:acyl dehydratase
MKAYRIDTLASFVGKHLGTSEWTEISQARIDEFASCTGDNFWYHTDPARARDHSPFGTTIAHGYLSLSLLASLGNEIGMVPSDAPGVLNYGVNRARFVTPVKVGSRVRLSLSLAALEQHPAGTMLVLNNVLELEASASPALVAETLILLVDNP